MKTVHIFGSAMILLLSASSCNDSDKNRYTNLTSGQEVTLIEGDNGIMIDEITKKPVLLYVDSRKGDTIYGPTKKVVNGNIERVREGVYLYDDGGKGRIKIDGEEYKIENGEVKIKREGEEYKYKDGEVTIKSEDGDYKEERKGYTKKVDADGDIKIETKDTKTKIDGETGEVKVKKKSIFSKVKDKVTGQ